MKGAQGILSKAGLGLAAAGAAAILAGCPAKASCPTTFPPDMPNMPFQHIKIFNDSSEYLFPTLDTGKHPLNDGDIWMQGIFEVPNSQSPFSSNQTKGNCAYPVTLDYRIYINEASGIEPGGSVDLSLPLFTQLIANPSGTVNNEYAEWWQGQNLWIFSNSSASPPAAVKNWLGNVNGVRPNQKTLTAATSGFNSFPTCTYTPKSGAAKPCGLDFFSDEANLPISGPGQLFEATLGARTIHTVAQGSNDPPNTLDTQNADFDVSYVDVAYLTGAMGPFGNSQVGYVGSPLSPGQFQAGISTAKPPINGVVKFLQDFPNWPQFVDLDGTKLKISKLASPSNAFARLSGANAPADLPLSAGESWPNNVWGPIQKLRDNWTTWAGTPGTAGPGTGTAGQCGGGKPDAWCVGVVDVKTLFEANYQQYLALFENGTCPGTPITVGQGGNTTAAQFANLFVSHVYGWTPFTEPFGVIAPGNEGCGSSGNLLQNTPGYFVKRNDGSFDYTQPNGGYVAKKLEFDHLEYGTLGPPAGVVFNPWVQFLHGGSTLLPTPQYLAMPNVYAYSVDDAVGNIQAAATGMIIDVGGLSNLENQNLATPPITVVLGKNPMPTQLNYTAYRLCVNDASHEKKVNFSFPSFVLSAVAPQNCPVYLTDNGVGKTCDQKSPCPQSYTFTVTAPPPLNENGPFNVWPFIPFDQASPPPPTPSMAVWSSPKTYAVPPGSTFNTTKMINCSGNDVPPFNASPNQSSKAWCCTLLPKAVPKSGRGVFGYTTPEPNNAHRSLSIIVNAGNPAISNTSTETTCSMGQ